MRAAPLRLATPLALALVYAAPGVASAQTFDVKDTEIKQGLEFGTSNTFQAGLPASGGNRTAHDKSLDYGINERWRLSAVGKFERPDESDLRFSAVSVESLFVLKPIDDKKDVDVGLGWFVGVQGATNHAVQNNVQFGPILSFKADKIAINANPFFEKTFGRNRIDGIALSYGWNAKYEISKTVSIGVEGFGFVENVGGGTPLAEQEHRIGPALFTEVAITKDYSITPDFAVLFGLTKGTPDVAFKLNVGIPLHKQAKKPE
jgi:hypothetical protein